MELNAEQIKKALECCTRGRKQDDIPCFDCSYNECNVVGGTSERQITGTCQGWLMKDALALINSQEQRIKELAEENERVKLEYAGFEAGAKHAVSFVKADTVRKMQERLTKEFDRMHKSNFMTPEVRQWIIDQIAKEMVEDLDD
jgi:hypothetical protein